MCLCRVEQAVRSASPVGFPCVLERQTQLHFNDTRNASATRACVYMCVWVFMCADALLDHFGEKLLLLCISTPPCVCVCVCESMHGCVSQKVMKP